MKRKRRTLGSAFKLPHLASCDECAGRGRTSIPTVGGRVETVECDACASTGLNTFAFETLRCEREDLERRVNEHFKRHGRFPIGG